MTVAKAPLISIVDDEALVRDGIHELVESLGYKAISFESAQHFLASNVPAEMTCLITDMQMPGLSGLELQEALQSQGNQTPVIVITGYPNKKDRTRALENGAVGYVSKPFDEQMLIEMLDGCDQLAFSTRFFLRHCASADRRHAAGRDIWHRLRRKHYVFQRRGYCVLGQAASASQ